MAIEWKSEIKPFLVSEDNLVGVNVILQDPVAEVQTLLFMGL